MSASVATPQDSNPYTISQLHHRVVIVGGGMAGITVAARLRRAMKAMDIVIIEPSDSHSYQPLTV